MIQFNHVTKSYENGQVAVNNINLTLESGEMAYLKGHSGAGKTTLLKLIMMIETVSRGQIILNNENISRARGERIAYIRRQIGMIFQNFNLIERESVAQNVLNGRLRYNTNFNTIFSRFSPEDYSVARESLSMVNLAESGRETVLAPIYSALGKSPGLYP